MEPALTLLTSLLNALSTWLPSALLLWLASSLALQARREQLAWDRRLRAIAIGMAAVGIWWPLEQSAATSAIGGAMGALWQLGLVGLAVALPIAAGLAATGDDRWLSGRRAGATAGALLLSVFCITAVSSGPSDGAASVLARSAVGAAFVAIGLVWLAAPNPPPHLALPLRMAASAAIAAALSFSPIPLRTAVGAVSHPGLLPVLALLLLGFGLLGLVRERQPMARVSARLPTTPAEPLEDALTRLPTRTHFETQLAAMVVRCDASQTKLALLFIDLDGFKPVNDTFGHSAGDRVLQSVGKRLKECARSGDVVSRVGGDEFLVLLAEAGTQDAVAQRAQTIVDALSQPFDIEDRQVGIGCSIGIAFYPDNGQHAKIVSRADAAMYAAKRAGGAGFCFFVPAMEDDARERFDLLRDLRLALENNELELFYRKRAMNPVLDRGALV